MDGASAAAAATAAADRGGMDGQSLRSCRRASYGLRRSCSMGYGLSISSELTGQFPCLRGLYPKSHRWPRDGMAGEYAMVN